MPEANTAKASLGTANDEKTAPLQETFDNHTNDNTQWEEFDYYVNGIKIPCYIIPAENPTAVVGFCTGFRSNPKEYKETIETLRRKHVSIIAIALPAPTDLEFMDLYRDIMRQFYFSKKSPLYNLFNDKLPRRVLTHSTSALTFSQVAFSKKHSNQETRECDLFDKVIYINPFLDTATSSREVSLTKNFTFIAFTSLFKDFKVAQAPIAKEYLTGRLKLKNIFKHAAELGEAIWNKEEVLKKNSKSKLFKSGVMASTFAELLLLKHDAQEYVKDVMSKKKEMLSTTTLYDQMIIASYGDPFACPETTMNLAKTFKIDIHMSRGKHSHFTTNPNAMKFITDNLGIRRKAKPVKEPDTFKTKLSNWFSQHNPF